MRKIKKKSNLTFIVISAVIVFVAVIIAAIFDFNDTQYTVTITDKQRVTESSKDNDGNYKTKSKYLVFADDENGEPLVFENTDCLARFKFNSSNIQGQLKEGYRYKITVIGYRVPFLSWYQNIIKVEEVQSI